jgi:hypothetical protein
VRQLPTGEADLIVRGLAKRVRMFRTRVPAAVETVAQSLTIFGRRLLDVCVKFHAAWGRRARVA